MTNAIFFKAKSEHVFIAIHPNDEFYIQVELWGFQTLISKYTGKHPTELRLAKARKGYTEITDEEFVDAILKAHSILTDIPYL